MILIELLDRGRITAADVAEQVLRLVPELIEVGTDGKSTRGKIGKIGIFGAVGLTWIRGRIGLGAI